MYTLLIVLIVLTALLMVGIVLIQESKEGGLASQFDDFKRYAGVRKTADFVERTTWILAGIMVVICVACSYFI
jgi:preprotein translocase subunit SecG